MVQNPGLCLEYPGVGILDRWWCYLEIVRLLLQYMEHFSSFRNNNSNLQLLSHLCIIKRTNRVLINAINLCGFAYPMNHKSVTCLLLNYLAIKLQTPDIHYTSELRNTVKTIQFYALNLFLSASTSHS